MTASRTVGDSALLQEQMVALIRAFGLHRDDVTPCGHAMSVSEAHALMELASADAVSQRELGIRLALEKSTVSRLVGQLSDRSWLRRARHENDGRVVLLQLTQRGRRVAEVIAAARRDRFRRLLDVIPEDRRSEVIDALGILADASRATS